jgi:energy-converting hydrogenase Eha subunit E
MKINIVFWGCVPSHNDHFLWPPTSHPIFKGLLLSVACLQVSVWIQTKALPTIISTGRIPCGILLRAILVFQVSVSWRLHTFIVIVLDSLFADWMLFHPHLIELTQEIVVVHAHFIFCGIAIVISVISIVFSIRRVKRSAGLGTVETKNTPRESHKTIKSVQRRIMGLGIACAILLIFNVVKAPPFTPGKMNYKFVTYF